MSVATLEPPVDETPRAGVRKQRLLLVAYNFPPVGGAGVQRPVKWAKYLGRCGWNVTVLTTLNPSVPAHDDSLLADLPPDVDIVRARTLEPDYRVKQNLIGAEPISRQGLVHRLKSAARGLAKRCAKLALQPDPQVLWNHHAIRAGAAALRARPHDAILVTAPAYSSFFIGAALKRCFGLPLVLDYRDEWDLSGQYLENAQRDWISRVVHSRMQRHLLRCADAVVATTGRSTAALAEKLAALRHAIPAHCIYNGFDADDFPTQRDLVAHHDRHDRHASEAALTTNNGGVPQPERGTLRLVYTGTLWNLTDIEPLVRGIEQLDSLRPDLSRRLELVCVGRKTAEQSAVLQRLHNTAARLVCIDYCDHSTALQWLRSADALCLLLSDVPGAERVVPAKLFEYLAIRKQMLAICPEGETAEIVRRFFPHGHFTPNQGSAISDWLQQRLVDTDHADAADHSDAASRADNAQTQLRKLPLDESALREFNRESQTEQLAQVLNALVARH